MMTLAKYPNIGYAHIEKIIDKGAVYAHGRTKGNPPKFSMDEPIGGVFTVSDKDTSLWQREFERFQKAFVAGYLSYDWYIEGDISGLSIWGGESFADFKNVSNVSLENLVIEGVSKGKSVVYIANSESIELAGCVMRGRTQRE